MSEKLIITLTEHSLWGSILLPVLVQEELTGALIILEVLGCKSTFFSKLSEPEKEIVLLADKISDKQLMKNYSKETNIVEFQKKIKKETIDRYIRPLFDGYHSKIVNILKQTDIGFYYRDGNKTRTLYDVDKIIFPREKSEIVFNFQKDVEAGLRYFIHVKCQNENIDLFGKSFFQLCNEPAIIVIGRTLHTFTDIDIKKLLPFFGKKHIEVPPSAEKVYIEKYICNCVEKFEVNSTGLRIEEINPHKEAVLVFSSDLEMKPVLHLNFKYDNKLYSVDYSVKKNVFTVEENGELFIQWFYHDKIWENKKVDLLLNAGLVKTGISHFSLPAITDDGDSNAPLISMLEWLQSHAEVIAQFNFTQNISDKNYFLGEVSINTNIDNKLDWFDIRVVAIFGEFHIPMVRFRNHILHHIQEYVLPDDTVAILPNEWFVRYYELMLFSKKSDETIQLKKHHFRIVEQLTEIEEKITVFAPISTDELNVPANLKAELRYYQTTGFRWLIQLCENNFGGCLADDMGLGKTLQTIAMLQYIANMGKKGTTIQVQKPQPLTEKIQNTTPIQLSLFDAPIEQVAESAMNPGMEIVENSMTTSLIVMPTSLIHNWQNELKRFAPNLKVYVYVGSKRLKTVDIHKVFGFFNVVLTTYGTLRNDIELLKTCNFHHLILDESQYVKNPDSQIYKAVKQIKSAHKLALTGTPIENSLTDLWAQMDIINEGLLGSHSSFRNAYINPINKNIKAKEEALLKIIQPFILRRTKEQVAPELPPLSQEVVYCDMTEAQLACYTEEKNKLRNSILANDANLDLQKMAFLTLQGLTRLRLLANHPKLRNPEFAGESGKFEQIIMRIETLKAENHKVLVFSSFVKHLRLLADYFDKENWKYAWLSGATATANRESEIAKFTNNKDVNCFFISLKAGGVGLNLTAADYVFIIDPWWNPAAEMQALARSHRIGQQKNVFVYRFISSNTIEEKIRNLQESKSKLAETFVTSTNPLKDLSKEEMASFID